MILAIAFAVSCNKDNGYTEMIAEAGQQSLTINAYTDGIEKTKADIDYKYDVLWRTGDVIFVRQTDNHNIHSCFYLTKGEGTTKGTFVQEMGGATLTGQVEGFYPSTIVSENGDLVWPAEQTDINQVAPLYSTKDISEGDVHDFTFSSLGSVLEMCLLLPSGEDNITIKYIILNDSEKSLSGKFHVENNQAIINNDNITGITLNLDNGIVISNNATYVNLSIPANASPGERYEHLTLTFITDDGRVCQLKSESFPSVARNTVCRLTLSLSNNRFEYTKGVAKAKINNNDEDVSWVRLWAGGPKFAECNIGVENVDCTEYGGLYTWGGTSNLRTDPCDDHNEKTQDLIRDDDTASKIWGENWRTPKKEEFTDMINNCILNWDFRNGVYGMEIKGKGPVYGENSIFLPAAGYYDNGIGGEGNCVHCWSSSFSSVNRSYYLHFQKDTGTKAVYEYNQPTGYSLRAVYDEIQK